MRDRYFQLEWELHVTTPSLLSHPLGSHPPCTCWLEVQVSPAPLDNIVRLFCLPTPTHFDLLFIDELVCPKIHVLTFPFIFFYHSFINFPLPCCQYGEVSGGTASRSMCLVYLLKLYSLTFSFVLLFCSFCYLKELRLFKYKEINLDLITQEEKKNSSVKVFMLTFIISFNSSINFHIISFNISKV